MIFKVYYQVNASEVPVREKTQVLYLEGDSEKDIRLMLNDRNYNIELVQKLEGKYLEYEQNHPNFKLETL